MLRQNRLSRGRSLDGLAEIDDDPAAGLVNLFDLWMVFAVAVLLVTIGSSRGLAEETPDDSRPMEKKMRASGRSLQGEGTRLGVAYQLPGGEIVYVPEAP